MLRAAKPKLSLSISTVPSTASRPSLNLSTASIPRTPISPSPLSPTAINTRLNKRGFTSTASHHQQQPTYSYSTSKTSQKSILKKSSSSSSSSAVKRCQFSSHAPTVYCVTPIENKEDYWVKVAGREERRWGARS